MAAGNFIQEFSYEITCSICLEYFKDPVIIDCGHNFCQSCLTKCWEKSSTAPSCPQCRAIFQQQSFKPNRQLANILEIVKKFEDGKRPEKMKEVCKMHQEPLKLFCKNDLSLMCVVCDRSKKHEKHSVLPMEEAHQEYKEKISKQLRFLKEERRKCMDKKRSEDKRTQSFLKKLEENTKKSAFAFEQMLTLLEKNKDSWLSHVECVKENFKEIHKNSSIRLCEKISSLDKLMEEMEGKCQQSTNEFLQDIKSTLNRVSGASTAKSDSGP
ncbi:E3 ubiquitin-protein ligase TRIM39-like isoform X1 [Sceloporus undulatus]|uniref:E3 ubiquitin-protein ligase TRIM39-like isoform X1 n=1 Tax=Sceloporus undulatus TaxID=8520 RepID=UPI001C4DD1BF|nr:E3 ubiquitin-protein ligase TRIM39-like isoform X1 [Sceloporus undulatus]